MIRSIQAITISLVLAACGSANESTLSNDLTVIDHKTSAIVTDVKAEWTNGGINPEVSAVIISGMVQLGSNPCVASGNEIEFKQIIKGDQILVRAERKVLDPSQICTMEYNPVVSRIETIVYFETESVLVENVEELGRTMTIDDIFRTQPVEINMTDVNVEVMNGGFNPDFRAYRVVATVEKGSNSCVAAGNNVAMAVTETNGSIEIAAVKTRSLEELEVICPMVYRPVFVQIETIVRFDSTQIDTVILKQVDGVDTSLETFL